jgi:hypothetical protein
VPYIWGIYVYMQYIIKIDLTYFFLFFKCGYRRPEVPHIFSLDRAGLEWKMVHKQIFVSSFYSLSIGLEVKLCSFLFFFFSSGTGV